MPAAQHPGARWHAACESGPLQGERNGLRGGLEMAAATMVVGNPVHGGFAPARPADGRRRLGLGLLLAAGTATAGAVLGLLASPGSGPGSGVENLAWTATAAVATAQRSERRAQTAERALADARSRLVQLDSIGAVQELQDWQEAERLGLDRAMKDRGALWGDERRRVLAALVRESRRNGLDPVMVAAVIQVESRFDPFAVSQVGACGLMQLMPPTAQEMQKDGELKAKHLFNPVLNIELGTAYIAQLFQRFDGDMQRTLIAYNAGPSVARSLVRGSKASRRLEAYPRAVFAAYRSLSLLQQEGGTKLAQR